MNFTDNNDVVIHRKSQTCTWKYMHWCAHVCSLLYNAMIETYIGSPIHLYKSFNKGGAKCDNNNNTRECV